MARDYGSAGGGFVSYVLDAIPILMAGFALYGPTMGLSGPPGTEAAPFAMQVGDLDVATTSLMFALGGLLFGLARGSQGGSTRLGIGIALCAFATALSALQFVKHI